MTAAHGSPSEDDGSNDKVFILQVGDNHWNLFNSSVKPVNPLLSPMALTVIHDFISNIPQKDLKLT